MHRYTRVSPHRSNRIQVTDRRSGQPIRRIGNLSQGGLRLVVRQPLTSSASVRLSASLGVALAPLHGEVGKELIEKVDQAMYRAKHDGGSRYILSDAPRLAVLPEPGVDPLSGGRAG